MKEVEDFSSDHGQQFGYNKTFLLHFLPDSTIPAPNNQITLRTLTGDHTIIQHENADGSTIESTMYLGMLLHVTLSWKAHLNEVVIPSVRNSAARLASEIMNGDLISPQIGFQLMETYVVSCMRYGAEVYGLSPDMISTSDYAAELEELDKILYHITLSLMELYNETPLQQAVKREVGFTGIRGVMARSIIRLMFNCMSMDTMRIPRVVMMTELRGHESRSEEKKNTQGIINSCVELSRTLLGTEYLRKVLHVIPPVKTPSAEPAVTTILGEDLNRTSFTNNNREVSPESRHFTTLGAKRAKERFMEANRNLLAEPRQYEADENKMNGEPYELPGFETVERLKAAIDLMAAVSYQGNLRDTPSKQHAQRYLYTRSVTDNDLRTYGPEASFHSASVRLPPHLRMPTKHYDSYWSSPLIIARWRTCVIPLGAAVDARWRASNRQHAELRKHDFECQCCRRKVSDTSAHAILRCSSGRNQMIREKHAHAYVTMVGDLSEEWKESYAKAVAAQDDHLRTSLLLCAPELLDKPKSRIPRDRHGTGLLRIHTQVPWGEVIKVTMALDEMAGRHTGSAPDHIEVQNRE